MSKPRAILDLDGVLYQWSATARFLLSEYRGKTVTESKTWDHIQNNVSKEDWKWLWSTGVRLGLFRHGNLVRGAVEFVRRIERDFDIVVITARPEEARQDTIDWLSFHRIPAKEVHIVGRDDNKGLVTKPGAFFLDDKPENAIDYKDANPKSLVMLWTAPWNVGFDERAEAAAGGLEIVRVFEFFEAWEKIQAHMARTQAVETAEIPRP
jgi:uncharacterized HAD superfamily protein